MLVGEGAGMAKLPVLEDLAQARRFAFNDVARVGADVRLRAQDPERLAAVRAAVALRE